MRARGFTLLEVLIATTLLGVAIVSLIGLHARNLQLIGEAQDISAAGMLASQLIAAEQVADFPELGESQGLFSEDPEAFGASDLRYGGPGSERFTWRIEVLPTAVESLRQIRVSIMRSGEEAPVATMMVVRRAEVSSY